MKELQNIQPFLKGFFESGMAESLKTTANDWKSVADIFGFDEKTFEDLRNYRAGGLTLKPFKNMEAFEAYIQSPDYATESAPGICFGFNVMEHAANHYEFEVMLNEHQGHN